MGQRKRWRRWIDERKIESVCDSQKQHREQENRKKQSQDGSSMGVEGTAKYQ